MSKPEVRQQCCPQCPFARATPKEYLDTMGYNGDRFAGQALGPFKLPCHMTKDFDQWKERFATDTDEAPLCAGAAKYRENIGIGPHLPECLGRLEADTETVFANVVELLAHHRGCDAEEVLDSLQHGRSVSDMLVDELFNSQTIVKPIERES